MFKVLIFDFDGTIADSLHSMIDAYNKAAKTYGCELITGDNLDYLRAMHARDVMSHLKINYLKLPFVIFSTLAYFKLNLHEVRVFEHIPPMLEQLAEHGYKLYIVSTNSPDNITLFLERHNIGCFQDILSCGGYIFGKSDIIKQLLKKEGIDPKDSLYIGDEVRDIDAAHQAGIAIAAVGWGYNSPEKLKKYNPDFFIDHSDDLFSLLRF